MEAWGVGLFANDLAADLRAAWREGLLSGLEADAVRERLVREHAASERAGGYDAEFWIALAAAQHESGRLDDDTCDRAVGAIDRGVDRELWRERSEKRSEILARLRDQLTGPRPSPKRLRRPPNYTGTFDLGDVIALRDSDGSFGALVAVAGHELDMRSRVLPAVVYLGWQGETALEDVDLASLPVLWHARSHRGELIARCTTVYARNRADAFSDAVGEVIGPRAHPYRPEPRPQRIPGIPQVQSCTTWRYLPAEAIAFARAAGPGGVFNAERMALQAQDRQLERAAMDVARRADLLAALPAGEAPAPFVGEEYARLRFYLHKGLGSALLGLGEPAFAWVAERAGAHAAELSDLRSRSQAVGERLQELWNA
jgi:hypothetical protein